MALKEEELSRLISSQQESGKLITGLRRWKMRQSRRNADDLNESERWTCPFKCGKHYRSTSSRSIQLHANRCALRNDGGVDDVDVKALKMKADEERRVEREKEREEQEEVERGDREEREPGEEGGGEGGARLMPPLPTKVKAEVVDGVSMEFRGLPQLDGATDAFDLFASSFSSTAQPMQPTSPRALRSPTGSFHSSSSFTSSSSSSRAGLYHHRHEGRGYSSHTSAPSSSTPSSLPQHSHHPSSSSHPMSLLSTTSSTTTLPTHPSSSSSSSSSSPLPFPHPLDSLLAYQRDQHDQLLLHQQLERSVLLQQQRDRHAQHTQQQQHSAFIAQQQTMVAHQLEALLRDIYSRHGLDHPVFRQQVLTPDLLLSIMQEEDRGGGVGEAGGGMGGGEDMQGLTGGKDVVMDMGAVRGGGGGEHVGVVSQEEAWAREDPSLTFLPPPSVPHLPLPTDLLGKLSSSSSFVSLGPSATLSDHTGGSGGGGGGMGGMGGMDFLSHPPHLLDPLSPAPPTSFLSDPPSPFPLSLSGVGGLGSFRLSPLSMSPAPHSILPVPSSSSSSFSSPPQHPSFSPTLTLSPQSTSSLSSSSSSSSSHHSFSTSFRWA